MGKEENVYKTTKKDFKLFKDECRKWIESYGIKDWEFFFEHKDITGARANVVYDNEGRVAVISFNVDFNAEFDDEEIRRVAFHEITELLLGDIGVMLKYHFSYSVVTTELHRVIRRLENLVLNRK